MSEGGERGGAEWCGGVAAAEGELGGDGGGAVLEAGEEGGLALEGLDQGLFLHRGDLRHVDGSRHTQLPRAAGVHEAGEAHVRVGFRPRVLFGPGSVSHPGHSDALAGSAVRTQA